MSDGTGLAEALLGLDGFKVLGVAESEDELVIAVETTASVTGCWSCGVVAECQDRIRVDVRDLACFGRPARLVWSKRRWRCRDVDCPVKTWTERSAHVPARAVLTCRAGMRPAPGGRAGPARLGCRRRARGVLVDGHARRRGSREAARRRPRSSRARHLPRCRRDLVLERPTGSTRPSTPRASSTWRARR